MTLEKIALCLKIPAIILFSWLAGLIQVDQRLINLQGPMLYCTETVYRKAIYKVQKETVKNKGVQAPKVIPACTVIIQHPN